MDEGQNDIWLLGIINKEVGMSHSGVVDKPLACQPGVAGSIPGFSCLLDETLMTSAVGETLNTNIEQIKVRKTAKIRKRYNQIPHQTQDTTWESNKNTI